jgi:hypothetical protein
LERLKPNEYAAAAWAAISIFILVVNSLGKKNVVPT